jgi:predicted transcriptional regulator of viral defense system
VEKAILIETLATFDRRTGNAFRLTAKGVSLQHKCAQRTARNAIASLEEKGWMDRIGVAPGPTNQIGGVYRMTSLTEKGQPALGRFEKWVPE